MLITHEAIMAEVEYRQQRLRRDYGPVGRPRWWPRRRRREDAAAGQATPPPPVRSPSDAVMHANRDAGRAQVQQSMT